MTAEITGGCKCGAVRFRGRLLDAPAFRCHCRDCQQLTGSGHAEMFPLSRDGLTLDGPCTSYEMAGGSGKSTFSGFCATCGSQIFRRSERMDDRIYVHAGALDDPTLYTPARSIYGDAAQPWDESSIIAEE